MSTKSEETTAIDTRADALSGFMEPVQAPKFDKEDAGAGSQDIGTEHIILPRIGLLQSMSKAITELKIEGAKAGAYMLTPFNRPVSDPDSVELNPMTGLTKGLKMVVVRIYPTQRLWRHLDEGGGIICEADSGSLIAREEKGLCGAHIHLTTKKGKVIDVDWEGGTPTSNCRECVFGPAAAAGAKGVPPTGSPNPWLPKRIEFEGEMHDIPDDKRAPKCTQGIDVLALIIAPAFDGSAAEIMPAFLTFSRSSYAAGKQLAAMIKMASTEPAWSSIFELGVNSVTNDKGTFYVSTVTKKGYANDALCKMAKDLYNASKEQEYRPSMEDNNIPTGGKTEEKSPTKTVDTDEANVEDEF